MDNALQRKINIMTEIINNAIFSIKGQIVDIFEREIYPGEITIDTGIIVKIERLDDAPQQYIMPGLIDSHVHIESSMLTPVNFAKIVVPRGTIAVLADPHEIANVTGEKGIQFMINDAKKIPMHFFFGAPSCVPATTFETSGAVLDAETVAKLLENPDIHFLSEMMNYPGVINGDVEVMTKINAAIKNKKRIDGHAPGLSGEDLKKYIASGISTDHECSTLEEALEKINLGMKIQIREGSAAKNFKTLAPLFKTHPESLMFCTDDSHPDELEKDGHIDKIIKMGLELGYNIFDLLRAASFNIIEHYKLPIGCVRVGETADFIIVEDLKNFKVLTSFIAGRNIFNTDTGVHFSTPFYDIRSKYIHRKFDLSEIKIKMPEDKKFVKVIEMEEGSLITKKYLWQPELNEDRIVNTDIQKDILKIVIVNRYANKKSVVGFIKNFGLKTGAIASSIAHDSHNYIAVGVDDESIIKVLEREFCHSGGLFLIHDGYCPQLYLPIEGLMSNENPKNVSKDYRDMNEYCSRMGCSLKSPFMTLSFMSLLVIPELKISDKGLFDSGKFEFTELFE